MQQQSAAGEEIVVAANFRGPPRSGNGGYVAGLLARRLPGPAEVTLRLPTPLERPLAIHQQNDGSLTLQDGAAVVAEARGAPFSLEVPEAPGLDACVAASQRGGSFADSDYSGCFSCGRLHPDGLRVFAGPVPGAAMVAATWRPKARFAGPDGFLPAECLWAALDCSGATALTYAAAPKSMLTGRMLGMADKDVRPDLTYRVIGWPLGGGGRKWFSGTALIDPDGRVRGSIMATWIAVAEAPAGSA